MTEPLPVHVNRDGTHSIDVAPSYEATGEFAVVLRNHGTPTHVHLRLDGDLAAAASLGTANHYVEGDGARRVPVAVGTDHRPVEGDLEVVTGYGAESATVAIDLVEPDEPEGGVAVDERLARPDAGEEAADPEPAVPEWLAEGWPVVALAVVAVGVAAVAASVSNAPSVVVGLLAVGVGVAAAVAFLRRPA